MFKRLINALLRFLPSFRSAARHNAHPSQLLLALLASSGYIAVTLTPSTAQAQPAANTVPTGSQLVQGNAVVASPGTVNGRNTLTVNQQSQQAILNWATFNIGSNATVNFVQPSSSAVALNRVTTGGGSEIYGQLNANGNVFLVNPNGVLFGAGAQVNVGGLVASTMDITDADFMAGGQTGRYKFTSYLRPYSLGSGPNNASFTASNIGKVTNLGSIIAAPGGSVVLLGQTVSNQGVIAARLGSVALVAGSGATLEFAGNRLIKLQVDAATVDTLVANQGLIKADGGWLLMNAQTAAGLARAVVNHSGVIEAQTVADLGGPELAAKEGKVEILADFNNGTVNASGKIDISAPLAGNGGFAETSAAHVRIANTFQVNGQAAKGQSGNLLIDPTNFTISTGAGSQSTSGIGAVTLGGLVQGVNTTIATAAAGSEAGDILVNAGVSWASANSLTLNAHRNIDFSGGGSLNGSNAGSQVTLNAGTGTGATPGAIIGGSGVTVTAGTLVVNAQAGIGSSTTALQTNVNQLALTNTASGGIYVTNIKSVTVAARSANGDITINVANGANGANSEDTLDGGGDGESGTAGGNIIVGSVSGVTGMATTGAGSINLRAGNGGSAGRGGFNSYWFGNGGNAGNAGAITLNAAVSAQQNVTLTAGNGGSGGQGGLGGYGSNGGAITLNATLTGQQNATLTAGNGGNGGVGGGGVVGGGGSGSGSGFGGYDGGNAGNGGTITLNATLTAQQNATLTAGNGGNGGNARQYGGDGGFAGNIALNAALVAQQNATLTAGNVGTGGSSANEEDWNGLTQWIRGNINGTAISASAGGNLTLGSPVAATSGNVTLSAGSLMTLTNTTINTAATGNISLSAGTFAATGATINAGAHTASISTSGAFSNSTFPLANVTAGTLALAARTGIGSSTTALQTNVNLLALTNTVGGGIYVTNAKDLTVAAASTNGDISITTAHGAAGSGAAGGNGGNITVGTVAAPSGNLVGLTTTGTAGTIDLLAGNGGNGASGIDINDRYAGGNGGAITLNAAATARQNVTLTAGNGGIGGTGHNRGGIGGIGGTITLNAALTDQQNATLTAGNGGRGGDSTFGGGNGGNAGNIALNAALVAQQNATLTAGNGGNGGNSSNSSSQNGSNAARGHVNGTAISASAGGSLSIASSVAPTSGNATLQAGTGISNGAGGAVVVDAANLLWRNTASGAVILQNTGNITAQGNSTVDSLQAVSSAGDVVLNGTVAATGTDQAIVLAGRNFTNNAGANALATADGNWAVFSTRPGDNLFGGLQSDSTAVWGTAYSSGAATALPAANKFVFANANTATAAVVVANNGVKTEGDVFTGFSYTLQANNSGAAFGNAFTDAGTALTLTTGAPVLASAGAPANALASGTDIGTPGQYAITASVTGVEISNGVGNNVTARNGVLTVQAVPPPPLVPLPASVNTLQASSSGAGTTSTDQEIARLAGLMNSSMFGTPDAFGFGQNQQGSNELFEIVGDGVNSGD